MKHLRILAASLCLLGSVTVFAQSEVKQEGVATVTQDPYESPKAAQQRGIEDAQVHAIESAFPYLIQDETQTLIEDGNVSYVMKSNKRVRGIWIKHHREPECVSREVMNKGERVNQYTCTVVGLIREVKNEPLKFIASPLGAPYKDNIKEVFESETKMYVHFQPAADGYCMIFFRSGGSVSRIFPYPRMNTPKYNKGIKVLKDENYILYDPGHSSIETLDIIPELVQPLELWTDLKEGEEDNTMYVLFSENKIPPPPMNKMRVEEEFTYPQEMDAYRFEKWLEDRRLSDLSLQELSYPIKVRAAR